MARNSALLDEAEIPIEGDTLVRYYYTLHVTLMSVPFYTSEQLPGDNIDWSDVEWTIFPENIVTSCSGRF